MLADIITALVAGPLLIILYQYIRHLLELRNYPPGPFPLPLIGNLHMINRIPHKQVEKLSKKYGAVFSLSLGMNRTVFINSIKPAKEAMLNHGADFANRPKNVPLQLCSRNYKVISLADYGPFYKTILKIGHSALRIFGEGNRKVERICIRESEYLREIIVEKEGKPMQVNYTIGVSILNIMNDLVFGKRYKVDDPEIKYIIAFNSFLIGGLAACDVVTVFPWLSVFPLKGITNLKKGLEMRDQFYRKEYLEHVEEHDPNHLRDVFDCVIKVLKEEETTKKAGVQVDTVDNVEMLINDIFIGGTETTITTMQWAIIYFLHWPHVLERCHAEIAEVCGKDRYPELSDRSSLNYLYATIHEVLRFSSLTPFGFPRVSTKDTDVEGLKIPKGTQVIVNVWAIHNDEKEWENPDEFNPDRFLDEQGKFVTGMNESFFAFGGGKRKCFGEVLGKTQLFIILSRLVKDFTMVAIPGEPLPDLKGVLSATYSPKPYKVIFRARDLIEH